VSDLSSAFSTDNGNRANRCCDQCHAGSAQGL
jgi:hypothetical protein